ncbi:MAG TPA: hypothetical protein QF873_03985 [Patescibacteria group bacterium]|nr:hypothetical protein [Patescibacteria group bacterium]
MTQKYKKSVCWILTIGDISTPEEHFSSKRMQKYRQSVRKLEETEYKFDVVKLTPELLKDFVVVYDDYIGSKEGGIVYPVAERIEKAWSEGAVYEIITLHKGDELIGGLLFRQTKAGALTVAYRVFPYKLDIKLSLSPAYISEYLLMKRALELGAKTIIHGRDQNAYGLNSDIGLATYKLQAGAIPYISARKDNPELEMPEKLDNDVLVCVGSEPRKPCKELVLYTDMSDEEARAKYPKLANLTEIPLRVEKR